MLTAPTALVSPMSEALYDVNSVLIAGALLVSLLVAIEFGTRIGMRQQATASDAAKAHVNAMQSAILGILALLIGFTFSLALQRYDARSEAVVAEANAIGTAYLRAQLLPDEVRGATLGALRAYADLRLAMSRISLDKRQQRDAMMARVTAAQGNLWVLARRAAAIDATPTRTGLYLQALNDVIDRFSERNAGLDRHVPEAVLWLLYLTFLIVGAVTGFAAGVANHRPSLATYLMVGLIVILVFLILDLDRPRRGLIAVSQQPMVDLRQGMDAPVPSSPMPEPP